MSHHIHGGITSSILRRLAAGGAIGVPFRISLRRLVTAAPLIAVSLVAVVIAETAGTPAAAQEAGTDSSGVRVVLTDGAVYVGRITAEDPTSLTLRTKSGVTITIPRSEIASSEPFAGDGEDGRGVSRAGTRLLFTPSAWPAEAGSGYFAVYELFFPFIGLGVTDFLSLAGGVSIIPGADHQLFMIAPEVTVFSGGSFAAAAGLMFLGETGEEGMGFIHTDVSLGSRDASGTLGLGWGFRGEEISDRPVLLAGFLFPVAAGVKIVSENWFPPDLDPALVSIGTRFSSGRVSADFALVFPTDWNQGGANFIPWVSFAYGF